MKVRYNGPYDAVILDVPGLPNEIAAGAELDVDDAVAAGLLAGSFELPEGSPAAPEPPAPEPTPLD